MRLKNIIYTCKYTCKHTEHNCPAAHKAKPPWTSNLQLLPPSPMAQLPNVTGSNCGVVRGEAHMQTTWKHRGRGPRRLHGACPAEPHHARRTTKATCMYSKQSRQKSTITQRTNRGKHVAERARGGRHETEPLRAAIIPI